MGLNKNVDFSTAKLLKEKRYDEKTNSAYVDTTPFSESENDLVEYAYSQNHNEKEHRTSAPTIAEVVMWLYEKHGIWIYIMQSTARLDFRCFTQRLKILGEVDFQNDEKYSSPTEAYEAAIKYTLENLI